MKNKSLKKTLSNIFVTLLSLCLLGALFFFIIYKSQPPKIKNPKYTVGTIVNFKQGTKSSGLNAVVKFRVNGKIYKNQIGSSMYKANVRGEKYKVMYEETDPTKNIVLTYEPIFVPGEKTNSVEGKITRLYQFNWFVNEEQPKEGVEFEYVINGKVIKKAQDLQPKYKSEFPSLKEGRSYRVEYWVENPERSIIYLDSSTKEP